MVLADPTAPPRARPNRPNIPSAPPAASLRRSARAASGAHSRSWLRLALFGAGMVVAFGSLTSVLRDTSWWAASILMLLAPLAAIGIAKQFGRRWWQPGLAAAVVAVALLCLVYAPLESVLGIIPTSDTLARWVAIAIEGGDGIATQRMPAIATDGIRFLLAILALASVLFVAPVLDRAPAFGALPMLVVLAIPVAIRADVAVPAWFVFAAIAYLALLRVGRTRLPTGGTFAVATVVLIGALALPSVLPPVRPAAQGFGNGFGTGLNPLINLGQDLRRADPVTAISYTTNAPGGLYLRLATLDQFNGIAWEPDFVFENNGVADGFPAPPGLDADVARVEYTADIQVQDVSGHWLPVPYPAVTVDGVEGDWRFDPEGLVVRSPTDDARGQDYEVTFLGVQPNLAELGTLVTPEVDPGYLALPDLPEIITQTADAVAGTGSTYDRAIALQTFFTNGDFAYSLDAPVEQGYDGTGVQVVAEFLQAKSGYCVHFASAMAIMARAVGIPARIAVGFQPGRRDSLATETLGYTVSSTDLHAWPELYFDGIGWLRFEPTPGRGALPVYSFPDAIDDPETPQDEGGESIVAATVAPTNAPDTPNGAAVDGDVAVGGPSGPTPALYLAPLALLGLLLVPAAARLAIRWRRMRLVASGSSASGRDAEAAWAEIRDTAYDHDWVAPDSETPRQLSERLAMVVGPDVVGPMRSGVEAAAYDRPGSAAMTVQDVDALRRAIASAAALRVRVRATLLPPSLLARFGFAAHR